MLYQDITIVIASFHSAEKIFGCINSIDQNIKIIVIENSNDHNLKKYDWQKEHLPNQTGSENSYHPKKYNNVIKKKYKSWKS